MQKSVSKSESFGKAYICLDCVVDVQNRITGGSATEADPKLLGDYESCCKGTWGKKQSASNAGSHLNSVHQNKGIDADPFTAASRRSNLGVTAVLAATISSNSIGGALKGSV